MRAPPRPRPVVCCRHRFSAAGSSLSSKGRSTLLTRRAVVIINYRRANLLGLCSLTDARVASRRSTGTGGRTGSRFSGQTANTRHQVRSHRPQPRAVCRHAHNRTGRRLPRRRSEHVSVSDPDPTLVLHHAQRRRHRATAAAPVGVEQLDVVEGLMRRARHAVCSLQAKPARPAPGTGVGKKVGAILHIRHGSTAARHCGSNIAQSSSR
jgi:hypothetical protein